MKITKFGRQLIIVSGVMVLFAISTNVYWSGRVHEYPILAVSLVGLWLTAILLLFAAIGWPDHLQKVEHATFIAILVSVTISALTSIYIVTPQGLGVDSLLFTKYSAFQTISGTNPYTVSMKGAYELYATNSHVVTPTRDGGFVDGLSYPSMSFLPYVPFVWLGLDIRLLSSVILFPALAGLIYWQAPAEWGLAAVLPLYISQWFILKTVIDTDLLWVVPLAGAVFLWYNDRDASAVCYGIACAARQNPWFIAFFIVVRLFVEGDSVIDGLRDVSRYGALSGIAFFIPNVPFIITAPTKWAEGTLLPLLGGGDTLAFYGQGFAILSTTGIIEVSKTAYTTILIMILFVSLVVYYLQFNRLKDAMWLTPALLLFFNYRGLVKYYTFFIPIAIAILISVYRFGSDERWNIPTIVEDEHSETSKMGERL